VEAAKDSTEAKRRTSKESDNELSVWTSKSFSLPAQKTTERTVEDKGQTRRLVDFSPANLMLKGLKKIRMKIMCILDNSKEPIDKT
jgi:hypothetical protein